MALLAAFFGFWVLYPAILMLVLMFAWVAYEKPVQYPSVTLLAFILILQFLGGVPIGQSIVAHPLWTLVYVVGYFLVGLVYTRYFKLPYFCRKRAEEYTEAKAHFSANWDPTRRSSHPDEWTLETAWAYDCSHEFREFRDGEFSIAYYKGRLIAWITYWPWFLAWSLVHDLLREIGDFIYLKCKGSFERVAKRIYEDILGDVAKGQKPKS
ncbi:MAG: hypothetical protein Q8R30_01620 [bacterium]|nr:hypothetical protein [bacterium]MDZ4286281.1 hypothetical protein [Candidatus Sungbacteria bacterium]